MFEYNIVIYCIPEASAAKPVLSGDPYIDWGVVCGRKISGVKSETGLGSELDDEEWEEGGGGLGGGIDAPLDFLDCGFSIDGGFDSNRFESEKTFEEVKDVPEHAAWKTQIHSGNFVNIIFFLLFHFLIITLPVVLGAGHDGLDSGCPNTDVNDLSSTNALLVFVLNPLLIQLLARGEDILSVGAIVCDPIAGAENISANGLLNWSKSSEAFVDVWKTIQTNLFY